MRDNIVRRSELFFRTSPPARSQPRFLNENRILPPLVCVASVEALKALVKEGLPIELYFADEEGDPYSVELAGKLNGYVTGTDSDFVILSAEGYKGYIPMDDFLWDTSALGDLAPQPEPEPAVDDFQPIKRKKGKKHFEVNHGIIPPVEDVSPIALTCTVVSPAVLASHLELPISLLPLLGALVGNDFSASPSARFGKQSLFFDRKVSLSQRITRVSNTIRDTISNPAQNKTKKPEGSDGVIDLIRRVVHTLLLQGVSSLASGEEPAIIEKIVESALQYALPVREGGALRSPGPACLLGNPGDVNLYGREKGKAVRKLYLDGYHAGTVSSKMLDPLHTGTMWPRPFLEHPEKETVHRSIGRPIREWIYAILDDGVGLPVRPDKEEVKAENGVSGEDAEEGDSDDDELIDVVEAESSSDEDSVAQDPLAPLKGALRRLSGVETPQSDTPPPEVRKRKVITEYVRRGLRIDLEDLPVGFLPELLEEVEIPLEGPIQLAPKSTRLRLFLTIIDAEEAAGKLRGVPPEQILPALAVRWVVSVLYDRTMESEGSKDRFAEKWTRSEVKALLLAFVRPAASAGENEGEEAPPSTAPELLDRHVQLVAQVLASLEAVILLAQALLLDFDHRVPLDLVASFSGRRAHQLLNDGKSTSSSSEVLDPLMDVVTAGLDAEAFTDEAYKKRKVRKEQQKEKGLPQALPAGAKLNGKGGGFAGGGMFGVLADVGEDDDF